MEVVGDIDRQDVRKCLARRHDTSVVEADGDVNDAC